MSFGTFLSIIYKGDSKRFRADVEGEQHVAQVQVQVHTSQNQNQNQIQNEIQNEKELLKTPLLA